MSTRICRTGRRGDEVVPVPVLRASVGVVIGLTPERDDISDLVAGIEEHERFALGIEPKRRMEDLPHRAEPRAKRHVGARKVVQPDESEDVLARNDEVSRRGEVDVSWLSGLVLADRDARDVQGSSGAFAEATRTPFKNATKPSS